MLISGAITGSLPNSPSLPDTIVITPRRYKHKYFYFFNVHIYLSTTVHVSSSTFYCVLHGKCIFNGHKCVKLLSLFSKQTKSCSEHFPGRLYLHQIALKHAIQDGHKKEQLFLYLIPLFLCLTLLIRWTGTTAHTSGGESLLFASCFRVNFCTILSDFYLRKIAILLLLQTVQQFYYCYLQC